MDYRGIGHQIHPQCIPGGKDRVRYRVPTKLINERRGGSGSITYLQIVISTGRVGLDVERIEIECDVGSGGGGDGHFTVGVSGVVARPAWAEDFTPGPGVGPVAISYLISE